jgi:hypothetical protein
MPVHSRITSINAFATGKTDRVPTESNYVEDYFNLQTFTRPLTNNGAQKVTTYVDMSQPEDEGFVWHKFTNANSAHNVVTKLTTGKQIVVPTSNPGANGNATIGIGSQFLVLQDNNRLAAIENVTLDAGGGNGAAVDFETHDDGYVVHSTNWAAQSVGNDDQLDLNLSIQFKKKKKFLDIQTWTGNATEGHEIFHELGCEPGMILIKNLSADDDWLCYHKYSDTGVGGGNEPWKFYYKWNDGQNRVSQSPYAVKAMGTKSILLHGAADSTTQYINYNTHKYIGYFFADADGGFGDDGTENAIACGVGVVRADRYAADAFTDLGFEPDMVWIKRREGSGDNPARLINTSSGWFDGYYENTSGTTRAKSPYFRTDQPGPQTSWLQISNEANGFWVEGTGGQHGNLFAEGAEYIYLAVRKPQRTPEQYNIAHSGIGGTSFFQAFKGSGINRTPMEQPGFTPDMAWWKGGLFNGVVKSPWIQFKSFGNQVDTGIEDDQQYAALKSNSLGPAEVDPALSGANNYYVGIIEKGYVVESGGSYVTDANTGMYAFRKARGFFDTFAWNYKWGNVGVVTVSHSLGEKPEFMVVKPLRTSADPFARWKIYHAGMGATMGASIHSTSDGSVTAFAPQTWWNNQEPTASEFYTGAELSTGSGIADQGFRGFAFSSIEGICKVGVYTGTNQAIDVNCGFSSAPRFIMIKNANTTDNFFIWDDMQGMSISPVDAGEALFGSPGDFTWTAPAGITKISAVLIGGGGGTPNSSSQSGGGGGALAWKNNITVVPGTTYNLTVGVGGSHGESSGIGSYYNGTDGGNSTLTVGSETYVAYGGKGAIYRSGGGSTYPQSPGDGGTRSANTDGGGDGGRGGWQGGSNAGGGGGGAGGYTGVGGTAGYQGTTASNGVQTGADGLGGGAGGGAAGVGGNALGGGGGGTGLYGEGDSGDGGSSTSGNGSGGKGGSVSNTLTPPGPNNNVGGGRDGAQSWVNGYESDAYFGGGGGSQGGGGDGMKGAKGGIRIIWGENSAGLARTFPNAATAGSLFDPYWYWNNYAPQITGKDYIGVTTSGFGVAGGAVTGVNDSGSTFIYLAIA